MSYRLTCYREHCISAEHSAGHLVQWFSEFHWPCTCPHMWVCACVYVCNHTNFPMSPFNSELQRVISCNKLGATAAFISSLFWFHMTSSRKAEECFLCVDFAHQALNLYIYPYYCTGFNNQQVPCHGYINKISDIYTYMRL